MSIPAKEQAMSSILVKGVIRNGRVEVAERINLPDGSEVTITGHAHGKFPGQSDNDRPMTPSEIAETLAAMDKVVPFDMTEEEIDIAIELFEQLILRCAPGRI